MDELKSHLSPLFSSVAEDIIENSLDLNKYLITNKAATFYLRMESNHLIQEGIHKNDILVVDKSLSTGKIIIAVIDGEFKTYKATYNNKILSLSNDHIKPFALNENDYIWGIVRAVIRKL
jgi:DNA polymerase V